MLDVFTHPLPWYVAGPLIGLVVSALLLLGNKPFGISSNFRHLCAALASCRIEFFGHNWKRLGSWNLTFLSGIFVGAVTASHLAPPLVVTVSPHTITALHQLGLHDLTGLAPREVFAWASLLTLKGFVSMVIGGFLVGFGAAYAGGCTSGHAIAGLADRQLPSLLAVCGFFAGGLAGMRLLPYFLLGGAFGIVIVEAEVVSWFRIQEMFRFDAFHMYGILGSAILIAGVSLLTIKRLDIRGLDGTPLGLAPKTLGTSVRYLVGGALFGLGRALTGACPGPLVALVGAGTPVMLVAILSALAGTWTYGGLRQRLPH